MVENKKIQNFKSSGNIIVDQVGQMGITGNIVNPNWNYYVTNESGKTNYLAVQILAELEENYNCSKKQAQDALKTLIRIGVVVQHLTDGTHGGNVMYLELVPDVLKMISTDVTKKRSHRNSDSKNVPSNKNDITPLPKYDEIDISDIINVAQSDFNKITKAHKVFVNYKKPISSVMGFLRNAIIKQYQHYKDLMKLCHEQGRIC